MSEEVADILNYGKPFDSIREECGVFGVFSGKRTFVASTVYVGLFSLQHRGQEGCGIAVNDGGSFSSYKDLGLVGDVFTPHRLSSLGEGRIAIGHVRYGTTGSGIRENCQPIEVHHVLGNIALAHNGNLTNHAVLREKLELDGAIFHTTSDTETIAYTLTNERLKASSTRDALSSLMDKLEGAYSLVVMTEDKLYAVRDPHGFRPLCYGVTEDGTYCVASESCALGAVGARLVRDVMPGEILIFSENGVESITSHCAKTKRALCVFEYIYFARPDSVIDGEQVYEARLRAGRILAREHPTRADVVIGVPDSGLDASLGYSMESGIPYGIGFVKNKYIGRTFIAPTQGEREDKVRIKLSPVISTVKGKSVVLVDDSIVRGTTSKRIVKLLREAGAREVHMRISAPPFVHPCYYGTDIDSEENLIACRHTPEETAEIIGADSLGYLSLEGAKQLACGDFCTACFGGEYPTSIPDKPYKNRFEQKLSDNGQ